jgi:hypothetical protein
MPSNDPEKRRAYKRKWRERNREREAQMAAARRAADRAYFREQDRTKSAQWRARHPGKARATQWRSTGLPTPTRPEPEFCEGCARLPETVLRLDHDHKTGVFRGWLCHQCNTGLGMLGDTRAALLRTLAYLDRSDGV